MLAGRGLHGARYVLRTCVRTYVLTCLLTCLPYWQDECLPFEGFMEALCRLAAIKVLPRDDEIAAMGCDDAGQYVQLMNSAEETRKEWEATQR